MPLYSIHIHYFTEVLPRLFCRGIFKVAVALVFTAVLQIFTRGGREVGARGKDEVLPQPDGSILSGGTVFSHSCCFLSKTGSKTEKISFVNTLSCWFLCLLSFPLGTL